MTNQHRTLWLDPSFGASGDMMLGTLIGLGAPIDDIRAGLKPLAVDGWSLTAESVLRCSLSSTRAVVNANEHPPGHNKPGHEHPGHDKPGHEHSGHRSWSSIDRLLAQSGLAPPVERGSRATFRRLGEVEAGIHGIDIDEVHFHEVGAVDAIVDIVGVWLAIDLLGIETIISGPVGIGRGSVDAAHGRLPIPAPATTDLLAAAGASIVPVDVEGETITPTGAALLATMADRWGPMPAGTLLHSARGAGGRDPDHYPNVLTGYLVAGSAPQPTERATVTSADQTVDGLILATNLDDATPEIVGHTINRCLAAGADDAWATPIIMKKGRPGVELNVLCSPDRVDQMTRLLFTETGTLGLRTSPVAKHMLNRSFVEVEVRGRTIAIKIGPHGAKPEYEHLAAASEALDIPVRTLAAEAMAAYGQPNQSG
jgi:uncharacterized protein (TIGR00299 family) protein